ncbi:polyprenyl synthetase family protein [Cellulomonas alba]|uniref:Polyprenyl synthetase family protein n=1 Tax=Cellulomonas alba TaxID=3053467 RepID=A0ABT7SBD3_9CELL|nr:polyprenyl synthetase family protein [Cellulomonas alba]MDM7853495.1 polyprenyl synthetase family protein [Cellulomonas alba]
MTGGAFDGFLAAGATRAGALGGEIAELWDALADAADGGARMRPALVRIAYEALGGRAPGGADEVAAAVEMLHQAFLMHDDVIDHDIVRRGRLNVAGTFLARAVADDAPPAQGAAYSAAAGILAGDLVLVGAYRQVMRAGADARTTARLLDLFDEAVLETAAGELEDVRASLGVDDLTEADVLRTAERKTAAYSFSLPLRAGGLLAGAPDAALGTLDRVGRNLGVAFQLRDDVLGVFGDEEAIGKSTLSDLREGKITALVLHARGTDLWAELAPFVGNPHLTPAGAERARSLLVRCGSRGHVQRLVDRYVAAAREDAASLGLLGALDELLRVFATIDAGRAA